MLLRQHGFLPVYYFPERHVRTEALEPSPHVTFSPYKGTARYFDVRVGSRVAPASAWTYPDPLPGSPDTRGYYSFHWHGMDAWVEEDEIVSVHARDPYLRAETLSSSQHVVVRLRGKIVAETARPVLLLETGLVPRYYIPPADVAIECFEASQAYSMCPYKGTACYLTYRDTGESITDAAWYYPTPLRDVVKIANHVCFWNERADTTIEVDGAELPHLGIRPGGPGGELLYPSRRFFMVPPPASMREATRGQLQHDFSGPNGRAESPPADLVDMAVERAGGRRPGLARERRRGVAGGSSRAGGTAPPRALVGRPDASLFFTFGQSRAQAAGTAGQPTAPAEPAQVPASVCEPALRRVRALLSGGVVADSRDAILHTDSDGVARYYFPAEHVCSDLLSEPDEPGDATTLPGIGVVQRLRVRKPKNTGPPAPVAFSPVDPPSGLQALRGRVAFDWEAMDAWFEEDDEVRGHPRVPYHRVDALMSGRHVTVRLGSTLLADSRGPVAVFETGQPARFYLPRPDTAMHLLVPGPRRTESPYLGRAAYYSVRAGDAVHADMAWSYDDPIPECPKIPGRICFDEARTQIEVDEASSLLNEDLARSQG
jgi:uncharacterized protein (DUF427 family)